MNKRKTGTVQRRFIRSMKLLGNYNAGTFRPCDKCKEPLYITRLTMKIFCRGCWEYKEEK